MPKKALGELPEMLFGMLERCGVTAATICVPRFDERNPAARRDAQDPLALVAFPPYNWTGVEPFSEVWRDIAAAWMLSDSSTTDVGVMVATVTLTVSPNQVGALLREIAGSAGIRMVRVVGPRVRVVDMDNVGHPRLVLAVGANPGSDEGIDMDAESQNLMQSFERLAQEDAFGFITVERDLRALDYYVHERVEVEGSFMPLSPGAVVRYLDTMLFDAFPAQILGPGHQQRLRELDPGWIHVVSPSRAVLTFPTAIEYWTPGNAQYEATVRLYRQFLATCLSETNDR